MKRKVALFDWDYTMQRGYAFVTWCDLLVSENLIDNEYVIRNDEMLSLYHNGIINHDEMSKRGQNIFCKYLDGVSVEKSKEINADFKRINDSLIYPLMRELIIPFFNNNGIEIIIISGSPQDMLETYKEEFNISQIYGMKYEKFNGIYTGKFEFNSGLSENKQKIVDEILKDGNTEVLFAFGDSISDIPLLKSAKCAFVNNKTHFLEGENINYIDFSNPNNDEIIKKLNLTINKN